MDLLVTGYRIGGGTRIELLKSARGKGLWFPGLTATGKGDEILAARCVEAGFMGYVASTMLSDEGSVRAIFHKAFHQALEMRRWALLLREVGRLAITDGLTSLYNRTFTEQLLEKEIGRSSRYRYPFSLALVDVDGFKAVNDTFGHAFRDEVLKRFRLC